MRRRAKPLTAGKAAVFSVLGLILGSCYLGLAFMKFDIGTELVVGFLCVPGLYFLVMPSPNTTKLDAALFLIPLIALSLGGGILILKLFIMETWFERVPDIIIFGTIGVGCLLRVYPWMKVAQEMFIAKRALKAPSTNP